MKILVSASRQAFFDGLELKQQVVAERPHQAQPGIFFAAEFLRQHS